METIIRFACVGQSNNQVIGIVVPTFADAKKFREDFNAVLSEIPKWMFPKLFRMNIREIQFDNGFTIRILSNTHASKGMTLNSLYASSRVTDEQMAPHCFSVLMHGFTRFDDE